MELNKDLWELHDFLLGRSIRDIPTTAADICIWFPDIYKLNAKECNYSNCPKLYSDIKKLTFSADTDKIFLSDNNNFKCATKEEAKAYSDKLMIKALKILKEYWAIIRKMENNNQEHLVLTDDVLENEDVMIDYIKSFIQKEK